MMDLKRACERKITLQLEELIQRCQAIQNQIAANPSRTAGPTLEDLDCMYRCLREIAINHGVLLSLHLPQQSQVIPTPYPPQRT